MLLAGAVLRALFPVPRIDGRELLKNLYKMGNRSVRDRRAHGVLRGRPDDAAERARS